MYFPGRVLEKSGSCLNQSTTVASLNNKTDNDSDSYLTLSYRIVLCKSQEQVRRLTAHFTLFHR
jgi:hypothetical protein